MSDKRAIENLIIIKNDRIAALESQLAAAQKRIEESEQRCRHCGDVLIVQEDHLPIRVGGCLSPTYELLEQQLTVHVQTIRDREAEIAELKATNKSGADWAFLQMDKLKAELREREEQLAAKTKECEEARQTVIRELQTANPDESIVGACRNRMQECLTLRGNAKDDEEQLAKMREALAGLVAWAKAHMPDSESNVWCGDYRFSNAVAKAEAFLAKPTAEKGEER